MTPRMDITVDRYIADMFAQGRFRSPRTEIAYRRTLELHAEDCEQRDPANTTREHVKKTLDRWPHPNTRATNLAHLRSFYRWCMEEGIRRDNPAEQVKRPRRVPSDVYRMTRQEAAAFMRAASTSREVRVSHLGVGAGLRLSELQGMQGRHFRRPGAVWVSADIAKGGRERWVPLIADLVALAEEIRATVHDDQYVIPAERWRDPGLNRVKGELEFRPASRQVIRTVVMELGKRAGIHAHLHPHVMRHAFGDHIAKHAGIKNAQSLMGHADIGTTEVYTGAPTLDELTAAVSGFTFHDHEEGEQVFPTPEIHPVTSREAPTGIEPVKLPSRGGDREAHFDEEGR